MLGTFIVLLCGGMLFALGACRFEQLAWRFVRVIGAIAFALAAGRVTWALLGPTAPAGGRDWAALICVAAAGVCAAGVLVLAVTFERNPVLGRSLAWVGGAAGVIGGCIMALSGSGSTGEASVLWPVCVVVNRMAEAGLVGGVTAAWLLGHAYLTATRMTIQPLRTLGRFVFVMLLIRVGVVLLTMAVCGLGQAVAPAPVSLAGAWLILFLRVGVGLVAAGIFAYMVLDCVKLRSTQSATGILYFTSIFIFLGELSGQFLTIETGWPM